MSERSPKHFLYNMLAVVGFVFIFFGAMAVLNVFRDVFFLIGAAFWLAIGSNMVYWARKKLEVLK